MLNARAVAVLQNVQIGIAGGRGVGVVVDGAQHRAAFALRVQQAHHQRADIGQAVKLVAQRGGGNHRQPVGLQVFQRGQGNAQAVLCRVHGGDGAKLQGGGKIMGGLGAHRFHFLPQCIQPF